MLRGRLLIPLLAGLAPWLNGAESEAQALIAEVAATLDPEEVMEPGSTVWPEALQEMVEAVGEDGLPPADVVTLRLALADAWLAVNEPGTARDLSAAILARPQLSDDLRNRTGLTLVASWSQLLDQGDIEGIPEDPESDLKVHGAFSPLVTARAKVVAGRLAAEGPKDSADLPVALKKFDEALALTADAEAMERTPIYDFRILVMEKSGMPTEVITAWLTERAEDPALAVISSNILTNAQRMVGRPAPDFSAERIDGIEGNLGPADIKGKPAILYFFATWARPCLISTPAVVQAHSLLGEQTYFIGISLDNADTLPTLPDHLQRANVTFPVIGEKIGWDGEIDDAYHIEGIPAIILIDAEGRVVSTDLSKETTVETNKAIIDAIAALEDEP